MLHLDTSIIIALVVAVPRYLPYLSLYITQHS
jgi:hypothetical protein